MTGQGLSATIGALWRIETARPVVGGLSTAEIARAYLKSEATTAQRIVRATAGHGIDTKVVKRHLMNRCSRRPALQAEAELDR